MVHQQPWCTSSGCQYPHDRIEYTLTWDIQRCSLSCASVNNCQLMHMSLSKYSQQSCTHRAYPPIRMVTFQNCLYACSYCRDTNGAFLQCVNETTATTPAILDAVNPVSSPAVIGKRLSCFVRQHGSSWQTSTPSCFISVWVCIYQLVLQRTTCTAVLSALSSLTV